MTIHSPAIGPDTLQCSTSPPASFRLPDTLEAPALARRFMGDALCREHGWDARGATELVASELVTHAVLYGLPPFEITVACRLWDIRLAVTDGRAEDPEVTAPTDLLRVTLLEKIARNAGTESIPTGKARWYDIPTGLVPEPRLHSWRGGGW